MNTAVVEDGKIVVLGGDAYLHADDVFKKVRADSYHTILAGGTLIEGMGTIHSDFDIYVICENRPVYHEFGKFKHNQIQNLNRKYAGDPDDEILFTFDYVGDRGLHLQIHYVPESEILSLWERVLAYCEEAERSAKILRTNLSFIEKDLIHRIFNSIPLRNASYYEALKGKLDRHKWEYLCFRGVYAPWPEFKDVMGFWHSDRLKEAIYVSRAYLTNQMQALTHLHGSTNTKFKWLTYFLEDKCDSCRSLIDRYDEYMSTDLRDHGGYGRILEDFCGILDELFEACVERIRIREELPSNLKTLSCVDTEFVQTRGINDRQVALEYEFRRMVYGGSTLKCHDIVERAHGYAKDKRAAE